MNTAKKIKVSLRIEHDKLTGLVMNIYEWFSRDEIHISAELGTRCFFDAQAGVMRAFAWDEKIDGARAEAHRQSLECGLNSELA